MKLKNRVVLGSIATLVVILAPITLVISCGEKKKQWSRRNDTFENIWNKGFTGYKAKIVNWHDGDTPKVEFLDKKKWNTPGVNNNGEANIRIAMIDTPEIAGPPSDPGPTTGKEHEYAVKGKKLADKLMPVGTVVKIVTDWSLSYNRITGNIFFDKNNDGIFESSWAVTIMNHGLTMPFVSKPEDITNTSSLLHYVGIPFADAYNYASENKVGMFKEDLDKILKIHGPTSTGSVRWHSDDDTLADRNVYDYYKAWEDTINS